MIISEICIKRPVFATVLSLIIILVGLMAYNKLQVREYPSIDPPVVHVTTTYRGASPEIIETEITNVIEEELSTISGIDILKSTSSQGSSSITIKFALDKDLESAVNDIRDKVSLARGRLPTDIDDPIIEKSDSDSDPIIYLALYSDKMSSLEISDYADRFIKQRLQTIDGVAIVQLLAERRYGMLIEPNLSKLGAYGLTYSDLYNAIENQNMEVPSGVIKGLSKEFSVITKTGLVNPEEFKQIIIKEIDGKIVTLSDVANISLNSVDNSLVARYNKKNTIALGIVKLSTANPLEISKRVRKELVSINQTMPKDLKIDVPYDKSVFIEAAIDKVYHTIFEAIALVILIVFFFLRSFRAITLPLVTIPISIIGTFALMLFIGFSINILTLLALILAIGLVVDDAIVMMENIVRHTEEGENAFNAAMKGSAEIGFAVIAMTLTLIAVFIPIGFMGGITGKLFTEFAWTLAIAVTVSGFVALTLSPMMASKIFKSEKKHEINNKYSKAIEVFLENVSNRYEYFLNVSIKKKKSLLAGSAAIFFSTLGLLFLIPSEMAPIEDRGVLLGMFQGPEGGTLEYTDKYVKQIEDIYETHPDIEKFFVVFGNPYASKGISFVQLKDWSDRTNSNKDIMMQLMPEVMSITGLRAFIVAPPSISGGMRSQPINFVIQTNLPYEELKKLSDKIKQKMKESGKFSNIDSDLVLNMPSVQVQVDRMKSLSMGINIIDIGKSIQTMIGGLIVNQFNMNNNLYDVKLQLSDNDITDPRIIEDIFIKNTQGDMVPLSDVVVIKEVVSPRELNHFNRMRSDTITASLLDGFSMSQGLELVMQFGKEILPLKDAKYDFDSQSRDFLNSSNELYFSFIMALIFIYLVLSAQFESFKDPLIILLSVPMAMVGAIIALYLGGSSLNIYSKIGMVTLIGLVTKNGILIVEFSNQLIATGEELINAVKKACMIRLRAILMTNGATIIGAMPMAFAQGPGSASMRSIGLVIVGGLFIGTLFTLFIIPNVCIIFKSNIRNQKI